MSRFYQRPENALKRANGKNINPLIRAFLFDFPKWSAEWHMDESSRLVSVLMKYAFSMDYCRVHRSWKAHPGFGCPCRGYQEQEVPIDNLFGKSSGADHDQVFGIVC